jgi:hypothetical protein
MGGDNAGLLGDEETEPKAESDKLYQAWHSSTSNKEWKELFALDNISISMSDTLCL